MKRTQEEAAQTRQAILETALTIFSRKGFEASRLEDVAESAGVTRGAIYHHFGSKAELFMALIEDASAQGGAVVGQAISEGGPFVEIVRRVLERSLGLMETSRRFGEVMALSLFKTGGSPELEPLERLRYEQARNQVESLAGLFQAGISSGALRPDLDPAVAARAFLAYQNGLSQLWLYNREAFSIREQAGQFAEVYLRGIANP